MMDKNKKWVDRTKESKQERILQKWLIKIAPVLYENSVVDIQ
jgi:hypothetical protein